MIKKQWRKNNSQNDLLRYTKTKTKKQFEKKNMIKLFKIIMQLT